MLHVGLHWRIGQGDGKNTPLEFFRKARGQCENDSTTIGVCDNADAGSSTGSNEVLPDITGMLFRTSAALKQSNRNQSNQARNAFLLLQFLPLRQSGCFSSWIVSWCFYLLSLCLGRVCYSVKPSLEADEQLWPQWIEVDRKSIDFSISSIDERACRWLSWPRRTIRWPMKFWRDCHDRCHSPENDGKRKTSPSMSRFNTSCALL